MSLTICPRLPLPLSLLLLSLRAPFCYFWFIHCRFTSQKVTMRAADVITHGGSCHMLPRKCVATMPQFKGSFKLASMWTMAALNCFICAHIHTYSLYISYIYTIYSKIPSVCANSCGNKWGNYHELSLAFYFLVNRFVNRCQRHAHSNLIQFRTHFDKTKKRACHTFHLPALLSEIRTLSWQRYPKAV